MRMVTNVSSKVLLFLTVACSVLSATGQENNEIKGTKIDLSRFYPTNLPGDVYQTQSPGWDLKTLFNGKTSSPVFLSETNSGMPQHFTVFLQGTYRLTEVKIWPRQNETYMFGACTPKKFKIWGSTKPNMDGSWDGWTLLGEFESIKPSGEPEGTLTAADKKKAAAGEVFKFKKATIPVQYIRFETVETWGRSKYVSLAELEIYGKKSKR